MKILLVAPTNKERTCWDLHGLKKIVGKKALGLPLALPTLAALTPKHHDVIILNEYIEEIDFNKKVDLVGISFCTHLAVRAYEIADEFRQRGIPVILGGVHSAFFPKEALDHADCVLIGEAEDLWSKVLVDFENGRLQRTYEQKDFVDLGNRPIPRWDLVDPKNYYCFNVQVGRGCPHHCEFCIVHGFFGKTYRHKQIADIVEEIKYLKAIDFRKPIFFCDDNILSDQNFSKDLFDALIPLNIRWWCQASMDKLKDEKTLELMYKAGCRMVLIGFESVSQESLVFMGKEKVNIVDEYKKIIAAIYRNGIGITGFFVVGTDSDDQGSFTRIEKFIQETNIAFVMLNILMPFPGTALREKMLKENRITEDDWAQYTMEGVAFKIKNFTKDEIITARKKFLKRIYSPQSLSQRLYRAWEQGAFISAKKKVFTRGRVLFALIVFIRLFPDIKKIIFTFRCLLKKEAPSLASIALAINFYDEP